MLILHSCSSKNKKRQSAVTKMVAMNSRKNIVLYFESLQFLRGCVLFKKQEASVIYMYMCYVIQIDVKVNHLPVCMYYQNINLGQPVR